MLDNIGHVAGAIWKYLDQNNEATVTKMIREIGETQRSILMGIGWLAREGKIDFKQRKQGTYITLKVRKSETDVE